MIKISSKFIDKILLLLVALLPMQLTVRSVLSLPKSFMLINVVVIILIAYFIIFHRDKIALSKIQIKSFVMLLILLIISIVSVVINLPLVIDKNIPFKYYVVSYSDFWDSTIMTSIYSGIIRPIIYIAFYFTLSFLLKKMSNIVYLYRYLKIITIISCIYSVYQLFAFYYGLPFGYLFARQGMEAITFLGLRRTEGVFYEAGPHATFLSVTFPMILLQISNNFNKNRKLYKKIIDILTILLIVITLITTLSPIGILTPFIVLPIFVIIKWNIINKKSFYTTIGVIIVFLTSFYYINFYNNTDKFSLYEFTKNRLNSEFEVESRATCGDLRTVRNYITIKIIKNSPIKGIGPGNDAFYYAELAPFATGILPTKNVIINNNLKILADLGITGFILYLIFLLYPIWYYFKLKYNKILTNPFLDNYIISMIIAEILLIVLTFQSQTEFLQPLFWIVYTSLLAAIRLKKTYLNKLRKEIHLCRIRSY